MTIPHVEEKKANFLRSGLQVNSLAKLVSFTKNKKIETLENIGLSQGKFICNFKITWAKIHGTKWGKILKFRKGDLKRAETFLLGLPDLKIDFGLTDDTGESEPISIPSAYFRWRST